MEVEEASGEDKEIAVKQLKKIETKVDKEVERIESKADAALEKA